MIGPPCGSRGDKWPDLSPVISGLQPPIHPREEREVNRHLNSHRWRRAGSHSGAVVQDLERTLISDLDPTLSPPGIAACSPG